MPTPSAFQLLSILQMKDIHREPTNHTLPKQRVISPHADFTVRSGLSEMDLKMITAIYTQKPLAEIAGKSLVQWAKYPSVQTCGKSVLY